MILILNSISEGVFSTLVNTSLQITLLALMVWASVRVLRLRSAGIRYYLWFLVVFGILALPLLNALLPEVDIPVMGNERPVRGSMYVESAGGTGENTVDLTDVETNTTGPPEEAIPETAEKAGLDTAKTGKLWVYAFLRLRRLELVSAICLVWFIVAFLLLFRLMGSYVWLRHFRAKSQMVDEGSIIEIISRLRKRMGVTRKIDLFISSALNSPTSFGLFSTTIILPESLVNSATEELEMVLGHEMAHAKRHDYLVNLLQRVLQSVFFFHPFFHIANHRLSMEREHICDDWVIQATGKRDEYAKCLIGLVENAYYPRFMSVAMMGRHKNISRRVDMIIDNSRGIATGISRRAGVSIFLIGLTLLSLLAATRVVYTAAVDSATSSPVYRNPRAINVTYSFKMVPDRGKIDRAKDLRLWLPVPREWDTQKGVKIISIDPPPHNRYEDPEYGNPMLFWDFGKEAEKDSYEVEVRFRLETYENRMEVEPEKVGAYDKTSDEYSLYTRSTHTIAITPKIRQLAQEAIGDETNPYLQAQRITAFARKKTRLRFVDPERGRGTQSLLSNPSRDERTGEEYYEGGWGQRNALLIAMCRAVGIPARSVHGFGRKHLSWCLWLKAEDLEHWIDPAKMPQDGLAGAQYFTNVVPSDWCEFYIPNYGWVPSHLYPGNRNNYRWIISKGRDVQLGPEHTQEDTDGYGTQWVLLNQGRADIFMTGVWNIAKIRTAEARMFVEPDPFPAEAYTEYAAMLYPKSRAERKLRQARRYSLEWIDYKTRGHPDRDAALAAAYQSGLRGHLRDYVRGVFVCHMLRKIVGDDKFSQIFREYLDLRLRSGESVSTTSFQKMAENIYDEPLGWFFAQWAKEIEQANETQLPQFELRGVMAAKEGEGWRVSGHILQTGDAFFRTPVELALKTEEGVERHTIWQEKRDVDFEFRISGKPRKLTIDPDNDILKIQKTAPLLFGFWDIYPDVVVVYGTKGEADANKAAVELLNYHYLALEDDRIKADTDVTEEDLKAGCVMLFGRPATNIIAQQFADIFPIDFDDDSFTWQGVTYDQLTQGAVQVVDNPDDPKRLIMLCAGLSGEATMRIVESYLHDAMSSYAIFDSSQLPDEWFDLDNVMLYGDWEVDSKLTWTFEPIEER